MTLPTFKIYQVYALLFLWNLKCHHRHNHESLFFVASFIVPPSSSSLSPLQTHVSTAMLLSPGNNKKSHLYKYQLNSQLQQENDNNDISNNDNSNINKKNPTGRKQTKIEKANEEYKIKRLQQRMGKLYRKLQRRNQNIDNEIIDFDLMQREFDQLLGICVAANDWIKYDAVITEFMTPDDDDNDTIDHPRSIRVQENTYRSCLRECYSVGNGISSLKVLEMMQSQNMTLQGNDVDWIVGSLCKQNEFNNNNINNNDCDNDSDNLVLWKKALDTLHFAANHAENMEGNEVNIQSYNNVISSMENGKDWEDALSLLNVMEEEDSNLKSQETNDNSRRRHPSPNISTYHTVMNVFIASNQLEKAASLLLSMSQQHEKTAESTNNAKKPKPSTYTFDIVFSALTINDRRGIYYKQAVELLDGMINLNIPIPIEMFNRVISSCAKAKQMKTAMHVFSKMKQQRVQPDTVTYNSLISACANQGLTDEAFKLLNECKRQENCQPDVITYTNTIRACGRSRMSKNALKLLADAKAESIPLDVFLYTALIDVCGKDKQWQTALNLLKDMKQNSINANQHTYSVLINALGNNGQWERALNMLDQMKEKGMKVNVITYNSAIAALAKASRKVPIYDNSSSVSSNNDFWMKAMDILELMKSERVWPDKYSYSSAITCCASEARYQEALDLIKIMKDGPAKIRPNRISYTGAMTACARAGEWAHALQLFEDMKADGIQCDVVAYNALVASFTNGGKTDMTFNIWNEMCGKQASEITGINIDTEGISPDTITLTNVIACLERAEGTANLQKMDKVFDDAVQRQIILSDDSMDTKWEIDLSRMSLPVARAACRHIIKRLPQTNNEESEVEDLMLITGVGMYQQQDDNSARGSRTALREHIRQVLRQDFDPPLYSVIPENAAGIVQVNQSVLSQWIDQQQN